MAKLFIGILFIGFWAGVFGLMIKFPLAAVIFLSIVFCYAIGDSILD